MRSNLENIRDEDVTSILEKGNFIAPPGDIEVDDITPWKNAMKRVMLGIALYVVTMHYFESFYVIPALGAVLMFLGFRMLRRENRWFRMAYGISIGLAVWMIPIIGVSNSDYLETFLQLVWVRSIQCLLYGLMFVVLLCLRQGIRTSQVEEGYEPDSKYATVLILLYLISLVMVMLGIPEKSLEFMLLVYGLILLCQYRAYKSLQDAGYGITPAPVRISEGMVIGVYILISLGAVVGCAFLFPG